MKNFRVIWEVDIEAETEEKAALKAREIQLDINNIASFYSVYRTNKYGTPKGKEALIDVFNL